MTATHERRLADFFASPRADALLERMRAAAERQAASSDDDIDEPLAAVPTKS